MTFYKTIEIQNLRCKDCGYENALYRYRIPQQAKSNVSCPDCRSYNVEFGDKQANAAQIDELSP